MLLGNGDGTFQDQVRYAAGTAPFALVAGDFNGDGRTDLAVANYGSDDVSVLLGNGDGTFQAQVRYAAGIGPIALVAGDFNGDGRTDLAVANCDSDDVSVLLGNGDGTFQDQVRYAAGIGARRPRGGGLQRRRPHRPGRRQLRLQRRVGAAGQRRRHLPEPGATTRWGSGHVALVAGDFNGDGRTDLAVANYDSNDVSVLLGNGDGTFQDQVRVRGGDRAPTPSWRGTSTATAAPTWPSPTATPTTCRCCWATATAPSRTRCTYAAGTEPHALVAGDFNGDGRTDLAVAN